jgi:hypothetical protein
VLVLELVAAEVVESALAPALEQASVLEWAQVSAPVLVSGSELVLASAPESGWDLASLSVAAIHQRHCPRRSRFRSNMLTAARPATTPSHHRLLYPRSPPSPLFAPAMPLSIKLPRRSSEQAEAPVHARDHIVRIEFRSSRRTGTARTCERVELQFRLIRRDLNRDVCEVDADRRK